MQGVQARLRAQPSSQKQALGEPVRRQKAVKKEIKEEIAEPPEGDGGEHTVLSDSSETAVGVCHPLGSAACTEYCLGR